MGCVGEPQRVHGDMAPFPYFPFSSLWGPPRSLTLGHLSFSVITALRAHWPPLQESPEELLFRVRTQTNKKLGIKGGCGVVVVVISAEQCLDATQPSS